MKSGNSRFVSVERMFIGFAAGFLATLIFHQLTLAALWRLGIAPFAPFSMAETRPFGVPALFSLSFWGGVWGVPLAFLERRFPSGAGRLVAAFIFGALFPSLAALLIVMPLKGKPMGGGWGLHLLITAVAVNGAWGVGTALFIRLFSRGALHRK